jgi:hypothetical protein
MHRIVVLAVNSLNGYVFPVESRIVVTGVFLGMDQKFNKEGTQRRFEAALRGARIAGPKHNERLATKRVRKQSKKRRKTAETR